jgi:hypothetical protein
MGDGVIGFDAYNFDRQGDTLIAYRAQGDHTIELFWLNARDGTGESLGTLDSGPVTGFDVDAVQQQVCLKTIQDGQTRVTIYDLIRRTWRAR